MEKTTAQTIAAAATTSESDCLCDEERARPPQELASTDVDVLRAALMREWRAGREASCSAAMQTEIVTLALDLLVREPDIKGYFGALTKTVVEEAESHTCAVWLIDDETQRCDLWMAYVKDRLLIPVKGAPPQPCGVGPMPFPCDSMAAHLFDYKPGWTGTIEYNNGDSRLPAPVIDFSRQAHWDGIIATPLTVGTRTLGWMTVCSRSDEPENQWWRVALIEAVARQATLALHYSRLVETNRLEERRKATLEERNRLARDIHDNLAQGFAAILMQLQAAQRESVGLPANVAASVDTAVELARAHLTEARRSVGSLRPNVSSGEDIARAIKRVADLAQRTTTVPIEVNVDELPRFGDGVEREILSIAQEALTNAVRHSRAQRITVKASPVRSIGMRLSIADDGRGMARDGRVPGFGLTSMQERADRIGASLTIVTAPRAGTEVVLAWEPSALPTQVHVAR